MTGSPFLLMSQQNDDRKCRNGRADGRLDSIRAYWCADMTARLGRRRGNLVVAVALAAAALVAGAATATAEPRAVVELFTSQGCSSCPPADKLLGELAADPSIIALSLPVDYWDYLGWKDTLADSRFTARQKAYSRVRGDRDLYTPQAIINGAVHVNGSDRNAIERAMETTRKAAGVMAVPVAVKLSGGHLNVSVPAAAGHGEVWICAISRTVPIAIGRGENSGREIIYHNVVRSLLKVGDWSGAAKSWDVPLENITRDGIDGAIVYVQYGNRDYPGAMLGATYAPLR